MRLVLSGGGTGGHIYPALAIATAIRVITDSIPHSDPPELLYVGSAGGQETVLVEKAGLPFQAVSSGPIRGRSPVELLMNTAKIGQGWIESRKLLKEFRAQIVLSTGGYASFPLALAAYSQGLPLILYLPDVRPGWAVQLIARMARQIAVSTESACTSLPTGKTIVTGYPVRSVFQVTNRSQARELLNLGMNEKVLFISGASQGAQTINLSVAENINSLLKLCEVIHITGLSEANKMRLIRNDLPEGLRRRYHLFDYMHEDLPSAMAAADLAVCRSGASVIGELPASSLPAILVPYPYAGGHQRDNARYLEEHGAGIIIENSDLPNQLLPMVSELLTDKHRLDTMAEASQRLAQPKAASDIARLIVNEIGPCQ